MYIPNADPERGDQSNPAIWQEEGWEMPFLTPDEVEANMRGMPLPGFGSGAGNGPEMQGGNRAYGQQEQFTPLHIPAGGTSRREAGEAESVIQAPTAPFYLLLGFLRFCLNHARFLLGAGILLLALGVGFWGYFYRTLALTRTQLGETVLRLQEAETRNKKSEQRIQQAESRLGEAQQWMTEAVLALNVQQEANYSNLMDRLRGEMSSFRDEAQERFTELESREERADRMRELETNSRMDRLLREWNGKMVGEYNDLKQRGDTLIASLSSNAASASLERESFKENFAKARRAILFIRTDYKVRIVATGEVRELSVFGTGFFISPTGVGMTAQHVIFPWRYNKEIQASIALGMLEVLPDGHALTMWPTDARVLEESGGIPRFLTEQGYRLDSSRKQIRILHTASYDVLQEIAAHPMGWVELNMPKLGKGDLVVFQVRDISRRFAHLRLIDSMASLAPLDEVMVVGYPLSRLQDGMATPQPSRGRVRRVSRSLLELDSPLHPGNSGGPILDRQGRVAGLASAILDSPVYGVAVPGSELRQAWQTVREAVWRHQLRLKEMGCDPGVIDGIPGRNTLLALRCEDALNSAL